MILQVKHNIQNQEIVIVDTFNGELLSLSDKKRTKFVNKLNPFLSQRNADLASSDIAERNQIINDSRNIEYKVSLIKCPSQHCFCDFTIHGFIYFKFCYKFDLL